MTSNNAKSNTVKTYRKRIHFLYFKLQTKLIKNLYTNCMF